MKNAAKTTDRLDAESIASLLCDTEVRVYETIDSTNTEAKRICNSCDIKGNMLICAESQTAGRGRSGHTFYSPQSTGLYMTLVLSPKAEAGDVIALTTMAAVAVIDSLKAHSDGEYLIKWVNDIYAATDSGARKVCGILAELVTDPVTYKVKNVLIGIGINVTTAEFPDEIQTIAASTGRLAIDRNTLAADISSRLISMAADLSDRSYMDTYRRYSLVLGRTVSFTKDDVLRTAKAVDIADDGSLKVEYHDGSTDTLNGGEISVKL
nr:biotin--[acetyl-CoA-carboxylase] ligase [Clostridia bacterium]